MRACFILQVAYAQKDLKADVVVDMATLTGAQGIATGNDQARLMSTHNICFREEISKMCCGIIIVGSQHGNTLIFSSPVLKYR